MVFEAGWPLAQAVVKEKSSSSWTRTPPRNARVPALTAVSNAACRVWLARTPGPTTICSTYRETIWRASCSVAARPESISSLTVRCSESGLMVMPTARCRALVWRPFEGRAPAVVSKVLVDAYGARGHGMGCEVRKDQCDVSGPGVHRVLAVGWALPHDVPRVCMHVGDQVPVLRGADVPELGIGKSTQLNVPVVETMQVQVVVVHGSHDSGSPVVIVGK